MGSIRVGFGRYELGAKEQDGKRINFMQKKETEAANATDGFRNIIDMAMEKENGHVEVQGDKQ